MISVKPLFLNAQNNIEKACILSVIILQAWIFLVVPTDNYGDPSEYINIAKSLFEGDSQYQYNRMFGYPLLLKIFSFNLVSINTFFLFQSALFTFSLIYYAKTITEHPILRCIIYLPALVPSVAYMQKILFPDGVITSIVLLTMACLVNKRFLRGFALSVLLVAIKVVFVFFVVYILLLWMYEQKILINNKATIYGCYLIFVLGLLPAVYMFKPFPLYQTIVQVPSSFDDRVSPVKTPDYLEFSCGGVEQNLTDQSVLAKITKHSSDEFYMPFGYKFATEYKCTQDDMRDLQRKLIWYYATESPGYQLRKLLGNYPRAIFVVPQNFHLNYMFILKNRLLRDDYPWKAYYEDGQLLSFRKDGVEPPRQPGHVLIEWSAKYNHFAVEMLSKLSIVTFLFLLIVLCKRKTMGSGIEIVTTFIVAYGFVVTSFAFIYDRYVYVNLFLWMTVAVFMLSSLFDNVARQETPGIQQTSK